MNVEIRNLRADDKEALREICYITSRGFESDRAKQALYLMYCDYYVEHARDTSFVAVDENDKPIGYVFCAPNYDEYVRVFGEEYADRLKRVSPVRYLFHAINARSESKVSKEYPAHLHIDILPSAQRLGIGTRLMDRLFERLGERGVVGVYLCCGAGNAKGVAFYRKYGFAEYAHKLGTIIFTHKIENKS